jgi:hypothetical protein
MFFRQMTSTYTAEHLAMLNGFYMERVRQYFGTKSLLLFRTGNTALDAAK